MSIEIPQDAIPPQFDLQAYEPAKNFNLKGWYHNLNHRLTLQELLRLGDKYEDDFPRKKVVLMLIHHLLEPIFTEPELEGNDDKQFSASHRVVRSVSLMDAMYATHDLHDGAWGDELRKLASTINTPNSVRAVEAQEILYNQPVVIQEPPPKPEDPAPIVWAAVDLNNKDKEIIESFKMWLKSARHNFPDNNKSTKRQRKLKQFTRPCLQSWYANRVLPYIDLMLWNECLGNLLTDEMVGALIFPEQGESAKVSGHRDCTRAISDTVKPLARELLSEKTITRMGNLILPPMGQHQ